MNAGFDLSQKLLNVLIPLAASLAGAFFGAYLAYRNERKKKQEEQQDTNTGAVLETSLTLLMIWNKVFNYKKAHIDPFQDHPLRHILIPATIESEEGYDISWKRKRGFSLPVRLNSKANRHPPDFEQIKQVK